MSTTRQEELRQRIRTLTSLLRNFDAHKSPSRHPRDVLPFLNHFTTLLTHDNQATKVIAVTGSISPSYQVRTLVVAQNPRAEPSTEPVALKLISKGERSFADVIKRPSNAPELAGHIADVWIALSAFDPRAPDAPRQVESAERFFLSRSFSRFVARVKADTRLCGGKRLFDVIRDWRPERAEIPLQWVAPPRWLLDFQDALSINARRVNERVEWEFSDATKLAWAKVLETMLRKVDDGIEEVASARDKSGKEAEEEVDRAMGVLSIWCRALLYFTAWNAGVVKSLLTKTSMVSSISMPTNGVASMKEADEEDDAAELRQEPGESKGHQIFRYLKTVVAWHAAVHRLSKDAILPELLKNLEIGLVEVSPSPSSTLSLGDILDAFLARYPNLADRREDISEVSRAHYPDTFSGCIHAETALMGLVNYYGHESTDANQGPPVKNAQRMRDIIQSVAESGNAVIAASNKCCWCCDWLGQNLDTQFMLPGTHGTMHAWDPPAVGVSVSVLERLEEALWEELHRAVSSAIARLDSRGHAAPTVSERVGADATTPWRSKNDDCAIHSDPTSR